MKDSLWSTLKDRLAGWLPAGTGASGSREERALALLAYDGCPVCGAAEESEARWIRYFIAQGNAEPEVHEALMASLGPCGRHLRRLVSTRGGGDVFAQTAVWLARAAGRRAASDEALAPCPTCARESWAEDHAQDTLASTSARPAVAERLAARKGLCFPHLLSALSRRTARAPALRLAELGLQALGATGDELVARLRGRDEDAPARAELLRGAALPDVRARGPLREWAAAVLALDACPCCVGEREAVRGALGWIASGPELEPFELRLCPVHLGVLHATDAGAARKVAAGLAAEWSGALGRWVSAMYGARTPGGRPADRGAARSNLLGNRACRACDVGREAGGRVAALVEAALRDRGLSETYARSHGLCLRHLLALPASARQGVAGETLGARLSLLGWELEEAQRKRSWFARWEAAGPEAGAWKRLPGLLGGSDAGLPAAGLPSPR
ncbi:MAG TPA: hypothetical protein VEB43_15285 [Anaeromyxobacter sp.]|nr:hypothetical protein [Anaeromyxobacter sp.]